MSPHGFVTYLDYLRHSAASRGLTGGKAPRWSMSAQQCAESDRSLSNSTIAAWPGEHSGDMTGRSRMPTIRLRSWISSAAMAWAKITSRRTSSFAESCCFTVPRQHLRWHSKGIGRKKPLMPFATGLNV